MKNFVDFAILLKTELFEKTITKEPCSNSGDPGEACECCEPEEEKEVKS